jgi:hypothetical protein
MKEPEDMTVLGPVIEKQQKIVNDCVEKKLTLSKLQSGIWEKSNVSKESFSISDISKFEFKPLQSVKSEKPFNHIIKDGKNHQS